LDSDPLSLSKLDQVIFKEETQSAHLNYALLIDAILSFPVYLTY